MWASADGPRVQHSHRRRHPGWAIAPVLVAGIAALASWRVALLVSGCIGLGLAAVVLGQPAISRRPSTATEQPVGGAALAGHLRLFTSAPILLCFLFFALQATSFIALQGFMPLSLHQLFRLDMVAATATVTAFMIGSAGGTMAGGVMADRSGRHQRIIVGGLALAALILFAVGRVALPVSRPAGGGGAGRRAGRPHHAFARHAGARRLPAGCLRQGLRLRLFRPRSGRHPDPGRIGSCSTPAIPAPCSSWCRWSWP